MLYTAVIFGFLSSWHCVGMCGPIAMMLPVDHKRPLTKSVQLSLYHSGRIFSYAFLGVLFGTLGKGFYLAGMQQQLSIIVGILMILFVSIPESVLSRYTVSKPMYKLISKAKLHLGSQFRRKSPDALFIIGVLNGFLPCGMVYVALFGALAMQSVFFGMLYMVLFGIGTVPLMTVVSYTSHWLSVSLRQKIKKLVPVMVVIIGVLFVMRGMGLGIPFVSPENINLMIKADPDCVFP